MSQHTKPHEKHDFNWAKAYRKCSVKREFGALRRAVKKTVRAVQTNPPPAAQVTGVSPEPPSTK